MSATTTWSTSHIALPATVSRRTPMPVWGPTEATPSTHAHDPAAVLDAARVTAATVSTLPPPAAPRSRMTRSDPVDPDTRRARICMRNDLPAGIGARRSPVPRARLYNCDALAPLIRRTWVAAPPGPSPTVTTDAVSRRCHPAPPSEKAGSASRFVPPPISTSLASTLPATSFCVQIAFATAWPTVAVFDTKRLPTSAVWNAAVEAAIFRATCSTTTDVPAVSFPTSRLAMTSERIGRETHVPPDGAEVCSHCPITPPSAARRIHVEPTGAVPEGTAVEWWMRGTACAAASAAAASVTSRISTRSASMTDPAGTSAVAAMSPPTRTTPAGTVYVPVYTVQAVGIVAASMERTFCDPWLVPLKVRTWSRTTPAVTVPTRRSLTWTRRTAPGATADNQPGCVRIWEKAPVEVRRATCDPSGAPATAVRAQAPPYHHARNSACSKEPSTTRFAARAAAASAAACAAAAVAVAPAADVTAESAVFCADPAAWWAASAAACAVAAAARAALTCVQSRNSTASH